MNKILVLGLLASGLVFGIGCTTKSYVRKQTAPLIEKVNQLDELTAANSKEIHSVDARVQQGLEGLNASTEQASSRANDANARAQQAQQTANEADTKSMSLVNTVANLDNYHTVAETAVQFASGDARLSPEAKQTLDELSGQISTAKNHIVVVEGNTDARGSKAYNDELSERRAAQVVQYLMSKSDLPPYKVRTIGLGEDKPAAPNNNAQGRRQNRRVEVQVMSTSGEQQSQVGQVVPHNH